MPAHKVKVVYVTDSGFIRPTLVSIWSLLDTLKSPAELHVWGHGLTIEDWTNIERVAGTSAMVSLVTRNLDDGHLVDAYGPKDYISAATMGRLFIPRYLDGYVLYIDGDTLVVDDVAPIFGADLGDAYAGVIRDFTLLHWLADESAAPHERDARLREIANLMHPVPSSSYFNAGIMLFNCDAIRNAPLILSKVEDVALASSFSHGDQDHLNAIFAGNIKHLDICWNLSWGRSKRHRSYFRKLGVEEHSALAGPPRIIHYHGPDKPWRKNRRDFWSNKGRATLGYRRRLSRFATRFPDLVPT
jgi:lipopolysaccharide biosynthesis glycosyltransferase